SRYQVPIAELAERWTELPLESREPRLRIIPEFRTVKENSRKRTKMPTEQEAKPAVVTPSLQQWRSPSTFRGAPGGKTLSNGLKWYVNNEDAYLDSWEAFKNGLSGLFGDRQKYTRRAEEQLKCRAQRSGASTQSLHTKCIRTLPEREIVQDEVERVLAPVSTKPTENRPRPTYAAVTRKYRAPVQKFHLNQEKQMWGERLTTDLFVSTADVLDNALLPRERLSLTTLETTDGTSTTLALKKNTPTKLFSRRFTPSPTRGRSPISRYRSPSPYRRSSQSPGRRSEEN
ncbi:retrotrans_gag domain-containing protein, partial [Trichonephila clavipes]